MNPYLVVDNFYSEPHRVRELAIEAGYRNNVDHLSNFPGQESHLNYYTPSLVKKIELHIDSKISVQVNQNAFGKFRIAGSTDQRRTRVHIDDTEWSAIVYLSDTNHVGSGTGFFRHRSTGLIGPPTGDTLRELGFRNRSEFDTKIVIRDTLNNAAWEIIDSVEPLFNRCLILRGRENFHATLKLFGSTKEKSRLTQVFFFNSNQEV